VVIGVFSHYERHRSGLYLPYKQRPTAIDFFCGCGGISLGFIQAGFEIVAAVDYDEKALTTYMVNLGSYPINIHYIDDSDKDRLNKFLMRQMKEDKSGKIHRAFTSGSGWIRSEPDAPPVKNIWMGDVRKLSGKQILDELGMEPGEIDCVAGGPPCQGFSTAGKREVMDPRNSLIFEYARLILEIQPKTFMMENVPGILTMVTPEGIPVVDAFCKILSEGGFGGYEALKKTLLATSGAGVALKTGTRSRLVNEDPGDKEQLSLFEMAE